MIYTSIFQRVLFKPKVIWYMGSPYHLYIQHPLEDPGIDVYMYIYIYIYALYIPGTCLSSILVV